jgi:hypothetical protein
VSPGTGGSAGKIMSNESKLLPLWPGASHCVRCGHCCRVASCGFGIWNPVTKQCIYLVQNADHTFDCGKFDEIVNGADLTWKVSPAFGAGCCASMNSHRQKIIRGILEDRV